MLDFIQTVLIVSVVIFVFIGCRTFRQEIDVNSRNIKDLLEDYGFIKDRSFRLEKRLDMQDSFNNVRATIIEEKETLSEENKRLKLQLYEYRRKEVNKGRDYLD